MLDREQLDRWLERGVLVLVLAALVLGPLAIGAVRTREQLVIQGLVVAAVVLWIARLWINPGYRLLWPPICWSVLLFLGYAIVRYQRADIEYVARLELIKILIYGLVFFLIVNNFQRQESTQLVTLVLIFLAMGISLYAIYQFITNSERVWHFYKPIQYLKRGSGTYICPNHLAGFLEMILPLGLACTLRGRFGQVTKVLIGYASLVILAGIAVTISRGGWAATGITIALFFIVLLGYRDSRVPAIVCLVVLVALCAAFVMKAHYSKRRFEQLFAAERTEEDFRFQIWKPAVEIWKENFWWGAGPAHFDFRFRQHRPKMLQWRPERVHNDYLNTLADWGTTGFALVASAWVLLGVGVVKTWKFVRRAANDLISKKSNKSALVLGAAFGLVAILLHSFVDFNMHIPANAMLAVSLMAMLTTCLRFASDRYWVGPSWLGKSFITLITLVGLVYLTHQGLLRASEFRLLERAGMTTEYSAERVAALKQAYAVESMNYETVYEIGESLRVQSWQGTDDYQALAEEAMPWLERSMKLNRYDAYSPLGYGMCLDWLGRIEEAEPYFQRAIALDPNSYFMAAHQGWHYFQAGQYASAKRWFEYSLELKPYFNDMATSYLGIIERKLSQSPLTK